MKKEDLLEVTVSREGHVVLFHYEYNIILGSIGRVDHCGAGRRVDRCALSAGDSRQSCLPKSRMSVHYHSFKVYNASQLNL